MTKQKSTATPLSGGKENHDINSQSGMIEPLPLEAAGGLADGASYVSSQMLPSFIELQSDEEEAEMYRQMAKANGGKMKKYKKEKSLGILCQQFIHLFVTWKHVLSLEEAAKKISFCESPDQVEEQREQKLKTKIRRLYDIANVLQSIGLIEKCHAINSKKPAFKWIGLQGTIDSVNELRELNLQYVQQQTTSELNLSRQQSALISIKAPDCPN